ncbi:MAG TPA: hypothetical protein VJ943_16480 [Desulfotignum sp.]|nr:hypothetical protein [Desulfotignum sp.]
MNDITASTRQKKNGTRNLRLQQSKSVCFHLTERVLLAIFIAYDPTG